MNNNSFIAEGQQNFSLNGLRQSRIEVSAIDGAA
jgi:hypothetical protein